MDLSKNLLGGLFGAVVLNLVHEAARRIWVDAPQIQEVGEEAVVKTALATGITPPTGNALYGTTLFADLAGNASYFSVIGTGDPKGIWARGAAYGIAAGVGALGLTKPLGLDDRPINRNVRTQILTVAWYTIGGIAAAGAIKILQNKWK
ncbi:hypothetical protein DSL64_16830 [Dyadobacter luteus]|jgi:hypothetical protein|uniref:DUF1440 domain-containing protein n=1 Tax=Dyadobacter luteus TaxID=2259619 RepID=A0A3D8Y9R5_9BACT|nr:hypothetical protein [Dyadobacter luteus]REA59672.1 hypothetical protein DSL64_16830 [Dyadobacter luteus]